MCFNQSVSIQTYLIGMFGSLLLYKQNRPLGAFYMTVIQMQLIEFILWSCSTSCSRLNALATKAGIVINHLEPLLYALMTVKYTTVALRKDLCTKVTPESAPHLQWQWNYEDGNGLYYVMFLLFLVLLSVYGLPADLGVLHAFIVVLTFAFSKVVYGRQKATGAMWCFFAAFVPYILLALS